MAGVRGAMAVLVLLLLAGCTTVSGQAEPTPPSPSAPLRPREVRIDGVDPCSLLTEQQRAELGLDGQPRFDRSPSLLFPGDVSMCVIRGFSAQAVVVSIGLVTTAGLELVSSQNLAGDIAPTSIAEFPAAVGHPPQYTQFCNVFVDVAPGQLIDVQALDGGRQPPIPEDELCRHAERTATAAMQTLLSDR